MPTDLQKIISKNFSSKKSLLKILSSKKITHKKLNNDLLESLKQIKLESKATTNLKSMIDCVLIKKISKTLNQKFFKQKEGEFVDYTLKSKLDILNKDEIRSVIMRRANNIGLEVEDGVYEIFKEYYSGMMKNFIEKRNSNKN